MQNIKVTKVVVEKKLEFLMFSFLLCPLLHSAVATAVKFLLSPNSPNKICRVRIFTLKPKWFARTHALTKAYTRR